jgi:type IV pilus assembly protein PilY1
MAKQADVVLKKTSIAVAVGLAMFSTLMAVSAPIATHASDIEIYQQARDGTVSLMFMIDISGSMSRYAQYRCWDFRRINSIWT